MHKLPDIIRSIHLDSVGEVSKQKFTGTFRVKIVLTNADKLAIEREYARISAREESMSSGNKLLAGTIAELSIRVLNAPQWFNDAIRGQNMIDENPLFDLIVKINQEYKQWQKELSEVATAGDESNVVDSEPSGS
jgi:hypothetical protein